MSLLARQLLVCLGAAHTLGYFVLPYERVAAHKSKIVRVLPHALASAILSYLICGSWSAWLIPAGVFVTHLLVDAFRIRVRPQDAVCFLLEQSAHIAALLLIAVAAARQNPSLYFATAFGAASLKTLMIVLGFVLAVFGGGVLVGLAVKPLLAELKKETGGSGRVSREGRGFEHGGKYIGLLERALTFFFTLTGQAASIGFLIADKSIFRFGELRDHRHRMEAEYIIIGSMMSFGFGLLVAFGVQWLLGLKWT